MSQALHYTADLRDLEFNLFEFLRVQDTTLGKGPFASMDAQTAREALTALAKLSINELAPSYVVSDREPPVWSADEIVLPDGVKKAMDAYFEGEWHRLDVPEHMGGFAAPPTVAWAGFELVSGANPCLSFLSFGAFMARVIDALGTPSQKARFLPHMVDRCWGGAMVLTEPEAGSDVGAGRSKATHLHDDVWAIEGVKRFITNGIYDYTENIIHLVLARPEGAMAGTKGLSLFIVPRYWVEEDGSLGEHNGMQCTGLEKKMGLKGSVTCEMTYGDGAVCKGFLMGEVHDGIRQMFMVIEQARMAVGVKGMAALSAGYFQALAYAKERVQGPDLARAAEKSSPRVEIIRHPDVRRMLMVQKAYAQGLRALALYIASIQDEIELLGGHHSKEARGLNRLNDLMLPLLKGYGSEKTYELLAVSLQCFGGAGYCQDYPVEQYIRDSKIDTLYEGTTHIQALDLLLRKVARDGGKTLQVHFGRIQATLDAKEGGEALAEARARLARGLGDVQGTFGALMSKVGASIYHAGLQGNRVLFALAEVTIGWLLIRHAAVAVAAIEGASSADKGYYGGKIAVANWFASNVLPGLTGIRKLVEASSLELMEMDDACF